MNLSILASLQLSINIICQNLRLVNHVRCLCTLRILFPNWRMGKVKTEPVDASVGDISIKEEPASYEDKLKNCSLIAKPMAPKKLSKKFYKLIKKASTQKKFLNCGLKLVQKQVRLGHKGIVIFAGDISPIEIMCHMPGMCEDKSIPYCYVPSRQDIGTAMGVKRGCLMVLVREHEDYKDLYDECKSELKNLPMPL